MTTTQLKTARYYSLNVADLIALMMLARDGDLPMTALAAELTVSPAALTGIGDRLAKKGLVQRRPSTLDRRSVTLSITETGRSRLYQITGDAVLA